VKDNSLYRWFRAVLGRMTMYRLILTCLGLLAAVALVASVLDLIAYTPLAVVLSCIVPLVTSFASNRVLAAIFRVTPHSESALITGYLIFFVFPPSSGVVPLLGFALAAVLASASKYILTVRGRHIFNPAAMGVFALTLTGVYFSGWWVGNPVMLPFSLLGAALILQRTRRLPMAGLFVLVAGGIMVGRSLAAGVPLTTALIWPLASSPMIFFAGFMLSEPLTQPPLRWQQLSMAVVVGCLFSIPMHLGHVYIAPESALLAGNALAFGFGQRKGIQLVLRRKTTLTPTSLEFAFTPTRRLSFQPGQYLEVTLPHKGADDRGLRRVFSISSSPAAANTLSISTRIPDKPSTFKQTLAGLVEGTTITATTIAGDFVLPKDTQVPILLIAGGIGITPFASQLGAPAATIDRDVVLVYLIRSEEEITYRELLEQSGVAVILVSAEALDQLPDRWSSVVGKAVDQNLLQRCVPDIARRHVYVSGPPKLVTGAKAAARRLGAPAVHTDYFSGY
jgi:ferredoxin-NADP reductase